jgi:energy-coupling factor transporter ATP-binding protein EcfA2
MTSPPAIEARGWGWRYPGRRGWALRGVDLRIEPGERILLLAPSGGGKSTLLAGIAGLLDPIGGGRAEGELRVGGRDPRQARGEVGLVFQDPEAQLVMGRAGDDVAFGLENLCVPTGSIWGEVARAFHAVGFPYGPERSTNALSGGEKQRLAIAGVLALRPSVLLLDEPTANLDPAGAEAVSGVVRLLAERGGTTLLLVEHRVEQAASLVDRAVVLEPGGGVVADGPPRKVFAEHGDRLAGAGVWIPDRPFGPPPRRPRGRPHTLVLAERASFRYPGAATEALHSADLTVRASEALALVGPNGSGKTTLALLLAGLLRPTSGAVLASEALVPGRGRDPIWRWRAGVLVRHFGTVFQEPEHQFLAARVDDELALGPVRAGVPRVTAHRRGRELLERLHLGHLAAANPFTLSGGEKRRLSVATALATDPSVLILDEPTFGQDRRTWVELLHLLAALRDSGRAICFASHDQAFIAALADRTVTLRSGRLRVAGA